MAKSRRVGRQVGEALSDLPKNTFLAGLPSDRREEAAIVVKLLEDSMPAGYEPALSGKMLVYQVPLATYPDTYNKHPLWYVALANEKSYLSLHLMPVYGNKELADSLALGFESAGKKLDMGKACVRFKRADDLALDALAEIVKAIPMARWIEIAKAARRKA